MERRTHAHGARRGGDGGDSLRLRFLGGRFRHLRGCHSGRGCGHGWAGRGRHGSVAEKLDKRSFHNKLLAQAARHGLRQPGIREVLQLKTDAAIPYNCNWYGTVQQLDKRSDMTCCFVPAGSRLPQVDTHCFDHLPEASHRRAPLRLVHDLAQDSRAQRLLLHRA
jgi:hypothetical protein